MALDSVQGMRCRTGHDTCRICDNHEHSRSLWLMQEKDHDIQRVGIRQSGRCDNGNTCRSLSCLGQAQEQQILCGMASRGLLAAEGSLEGMLGMPSNTQITVLPLSYV